MSSPEDNNKTGLPKVEEEIITDIAYMMEEYYYPTDDLILNKGDVVDGILFIIEGEIHITLKSSTTQEYLVDRLYKRCTYGYHQVLKILKDDNSPLPQSEHRLVSQADTIILKLPYTNLRNMRKKSKYLSKIIDQSSKFIPQCDFTTFLTYNKKLSIRQLRTKFKRAVRRQIQITRDKVFRAKLFNLAMYKENLNDNQGNEMNKEFFEDDENIKQIELSQRA